MTEASGNPADWKALGLQIGADFAKIAADNLGKQAGRDSEQSRSDAPMNWKPWAIGGAVLLVVVVLVLRRR
jgi:hypothetical protein